MPLLVPRLQLDVPTSSPPSVSISVSLLIVLGHFSASPSPIECVVSSILASSVSFLCCFCASSSLSLCSLSSLLYMSAALSPQLKLCRCVCGDFYLPHSSALFRTHLFFKSSVCENKRISKRQPNLYDYSKNP